MRHFHTWPYDCGYPGHHSTLGLLDLGIAAIWGGGALIILCGGGLSCML